MSESTEQIGFWEQLKKYFLIPIDNSLLSIAPEMGHLSPLILIMGTAFLSFVTLNLPLGVFAGSSIEALFFYTIIQSVGELLSTPTSGIRNSSTIDTPACKSYFQSLTPTRFQWLMSKGLQSGILNQPLYFISFAFMYCLQSMFFFDKETKEIGSQYSNRSYITVVAGLLFITLFTLYLMVYGCDSIYKLLFSIFIGIFIGVLICYQNYGLFGKGSVNLLFIPPLERKSGMDFLCVKA